MTEIKLVQAAIDFANQRYPNQSSVVAAMLTDCDDIYTGVWNDASVDAAALCAETGPICQAHATNREIVASICVCRDTNDASLRVLPACGICQERLAYWGLDVLIAVPGNVVSGICTFVSLRDLRPHYWLPDS
ncbi:cytidine deaminase [Novipirellula rosea]|uniref:cytidine deaminase n=1 Tax=Novipirellula rosea TaxID=1031540 RepID=UPI0031E6C936